MPGPPVRAVPYARSDKVIANRCRMTQAILFCSADHIDRPDLYATIQLTRVLYVPWHTYICQQAEGALPYVLQKNKGDTFE